jgi:tetratricopeptide (TPR) repeat protein
VDIMQEIGKVYYYMRNYDSAYYYYDKFIRIREAYNLDIYQGEDIKMAWVLSQMGQIDRSEKMVKIYKDNAEKNQSIYKPLSLAMYYAYKNETQKAIDQLNIFAQSDQYSYWIILFLEEDPLVDNIKELPEFSKAMKKLETKFWDRHQRFRTSLKDKGLLP